MADRREYRSGGLTQRKTDWRWVGTIEDPKGYTASGGRKRHSVTGPGCVGGCAEKCPHRSAMRRRVRDKGIEVAARTETTTHATVKTWTEEYLKIKVRTLSPKGYNAAANPIRKWVVPTIGRKRLEQLSPKDIRAVQDAQRAVGRHPADTHRALLTMLRTAVLEGHHVPASVLAMKPPTADTSDRAAMTVDQGIACLKAAELLPHGSRWLFAMLYGARLGEGLGLTWDAIDFNAGDWGEAVIEWQLQALPYNVARDRSSGFRVPDGHESRHLVDAFHLVRPKSKASYRVAPLLEPVRDALLAWREVAPDNPWELVWPNLKGRPANDKHDRTEWYALQEAVGVSHPTSPRAFYVHECRNFAATVLLNAGVPEHVVKDLLGHSSVAMSLHYRTRRREPLQEAMQRAGERLQLGGPTP